MTQPFQEIAARFQGANRLRDEHHLRQRRADPDADQHHAGGRLLHRQLADELKPVSDHVATSTDLVKHIPVLVVPADNPKGIQTVSDLVKCDTLLLGDPESTPIGKIAVKAMTDAGIIEQVKASGAITTSTTAPQIAEALAKGEGDAAIVWKENAGKDGLTILENSGMEGYVKTVPSAELACAADADAVKAFSEFLQTETAKNIWTKFGYELV